MKDLLLRPVILGRPHSWWMLAMAQGVILGSLGLNGWRLFVAIMAGGLINHAMADIDRAAR